MLGVQPVPIMYQPCVIKAIIFFILSAIIHGGCLQGQLKGVRSILTSLPRRLCPRFYFRAVVVIPITMHHQLTLAVLSKHVLELQILVHHFAAMAPDDDDLEVVLVDIQ